MKNKKTTMTNKEGNGEMCGKAAISQPAEEMSERKLVSCSDRLMMNSANVEQKETNIQQPASDDTHALPVLFNLVAQRYEGETSEGQFHGEGVAYFEGGHVYKGMFCKGLMEGRGVFTRADGLKYEGEFVCNKPMGQGAYTWLDGSSYKGEVYNGIRHGTGTYECAKTGVSYRGQWDQGKRHGKGAVYYNQDKTSWYEGDWVKNSREGWGVRCYPSGNMYSGEWENNLRHGEGTMRWLSLGQQYVGMWHNGVQHGRGTHIWIPRRALGSQYSQSNQYTGDFVQGQRHGHGTFHYASGAFYEGEWNNNKRHAKGRFTFEDGRVFEGKLVDDQLMAHSMNRSRALIPPCGSFPLSGSDSFVLGPDMALNIEFLLDLIPERERDAERKQVEFAVLMQSAELRSIYSFYGRLGRAHTPNNNFPMTRLQLWRLLKDCYIHCHGITLTQIDRFIRGDASAAETHSPFTPVLLRRLISCLVIVAYHIYHKDTVSQKNLLTACFYKLMTDNILPNAKNVKGFLFRQPDCAVAAVSYLKKCWEIYQAFYKVNAAHKDDQTMTYRHLLWMFKDLQLLDNKLTTARLLEIIAAESRDPSNLSCLVEEITFLEFFEVLVGSAGVKRQLVSESLEEGQMLSSPKVEARMDLPDGKNGEKTFQTKNSPFQTTEESSDTATSSKTEDVESQQEVKTEDNEKVQSAGHTEEHRGEEKGLNTRGAEDENPELELHIQTIHQFFKHILFPAFEHHQSVSRYIKEEKLHQWTTNASCGQGPTRPWQRRNSDAAE